MIEPAFEALRTIFAPRPLARVEAAPSASAVFATVLLFGTLLVGVPWLRSELAPPVPSVGASRIEKPESVLEPRAAPAATAAPAVVADAAPTIAPGAATLAVQVNARPWANIEVDGVDLGPTPIAGIPLLAGPHRFRARMPDGRVLERDVDVSDENRFIVFE